VTAAELLISTWRHAKAGLDLVEHQRGARLVTQLPCALQPRGRRQPLDHWLETIAARSSPASEDRSLEGFDIVEQHVARRGADGCRDAGLLGGPVVPAEYPHAITFSRPV
jgi:hypothetical protein